MLEIRTAHLFNKLLAFAKSRYSFDSFQIKEFADFIRGYPFILRDFIEASLVEQNEDESYSFTHCFVATCFLVAPACNQTNHQPHRKTNLPDSLEQTFDLCHQLLTDLPANSDTRLVQRHLRSIRAIIQDITHWYSQGKEQHLRDLNAWDRFICLETIIGQLGSFCSTHLRNPKQ